MLDPNDPFFAPRWRRWAVVIVCALWLVIELARGAHYWAAGAAVGGGYALWSLFLSPRARGGKD
ncbi:hypothetical protein N9W17_02930 [Jannaschia sp.]|nr:hypothetical protein [Jannaschia sp.]